MIWQKVTVMLHSGEQLKWKGWRYSGMMSRRMWYAPYKFTKLDHPLGKVASRLLGAPRGQGALLCVKWGSNRPRGPPCGTTLVQFINFVSVFMSLNFTLSFLSELWLNTVDKRHTSASYIFDGPQVPAYLDARMTEDFTATCELNTTPDF